MSEEKEEYLTGKELAVTSQETRELDFYGDSLLIGIVDGVAYVALRPIVDFLKIDWTAQYQRVQRDDVLNEEKRLVVMIGADNRKRPMVALPIEFLHGWLFGITSSRMKDPEIAAKLKLYRRDCFRVLWREFGSIGSVEETVVVSSERPAPALPAASLALNQVRDIGLALVQMAEEQMQVVEHIDALSPRVDEAHNRLDRAAEVVKHIQKRLTTVERRVYPYEVISSEQATEIRLAVQRLGEVLTGQAAKTRKPGEKVANYYSSIFQEIYTRTGAPRYELIRMSDYADVMAFLESWLKSAQGPQEEQK